MRKKFSIAIILTVAAMSSWALKMLPFPGWKRVIESSPTIVLARCTKTIADPSTAWNGIESDVTVIKVLRGSTNMGSTHLFSSKWPRPGVIYLVFSLSTNSNYQAIEKYRLIPIGTHFSSEYLDGKIFDEQIQYLFHASTNFVAKEMKDADQDKAWVTEGLGKP